MKDAEETMKDFEAAGLPFAVLVDINGLVAWSGHPDDRKLEDDIEELRKEKMLFLTEDFHDDPDQSRKDPDEAEIQKEADVADKKPKPLQEVFKDLTAKLKLFREELLNKQEITYVDIAEESKDP